MVKVNSFVSNKTFSVALESEPRRKFNSLLDSSMKLFIKTKEEIGQARVILLKANFYSQLEDRS